MTPRPAAEHPAIRWGRAVLSGQVVVGELVRLAVKRHFDDLKSAGKRGLHFDLAAGVRVVEFFRFLRHSKGEWAGQEFKLSLWQQFLVIVLFGWKRADGTRRFRVAYIEIPRKNGKSTLLAGLGLYLFIADGEPGAEVYCAATKKDQAKIVFSEAERMVKASVGLRSRIGCVRNNMHVLGDASKFEPLGADEDTLDGLNPHALLIDELHAHKTRGVWDVLDTAMGARRQPIAIAITTAGYDRQSVCFEQHEHVEKIVRGVIEDDSYFGFIASIDGPDKNAKDEKRKKGDDWRDERVWAKANLNLGISVKLDYLREKIGRAQLIPGQENSARRLYLDEWTEQDKRWLSLDVWSRNSGGLEHISPEDLQGRSGFLGLDLSSTTDISAAVYLFPPNDEDPVWRVFCRFWIPEANVPDRVRKDRVPYDVWIREGWVEATEGNVIDYDVLRQRIREDSEQFEVQEIAFDRWNATQLSTQLGGDGFTMVPFGQGFASMAAPCRELEGILLSEKLGHAGNPVLRWMATNVAVETDPAGNRKPSKKVSRERIDGIVALLMALGRATLTADQSSSIYDEEELKAV